VIRLRIREREAKELFLKTRPIGLIVEFKQKKRKKKAKTKLIPKNAEIGSVHSKARHYKMINGKIVEIDWK